MGESAILCSEEGGDETRRGRTVENNNYEGMDVTPSCFSVDRLLKENQKLKEKLAEKNAEMEELLRDKAKGDGEMEAFRRKVNRICGEMSVVLSEMKRRVEGMRGKVGDIEKLRFCEGLNKLTVLVEDRLRVSHDEGRKKVEVGLRWDWRGEESIVSGNGDVLPCDLEQTEPEDSSEDIEEEDQGDLEASHGLCQIKYNGGNVLSYNCYCGMACKTRSALRLHTRSALKRPDNQLIPVISKEETCSLLKTEGPPCLSVPIPISSGSTTSGSLSPPPLSPVEAHQPAPESPRIAHAVSAKDPLKCICGLVCTQTYLLTRHIKLHMSDKKFSCRVCSKAFVNAGFLNAHYKKVHKLSSSVAQVYEHHKNLKKHSELILPPPAPSQSRRKVGRSLKTPELVLRSRFTSRKRREAKRRPRKLIIRAKERISCHHCHRRFSHLVDLLKHLARKIHGVGGVEKHRKGSSSSSTAPPTTPGPTCSSSSTTISPPRRSARFSEGWKPQRCRCDLNCNRMKLQKTNDPPSCTICGLEFACLTILKNHFLDAHNLLCDIPKVCEKCGKLFNTSKQLQQHMQTDHVKTPAASRLVSKPSTSKPSSKRKLKSSRNLTKVDPPSETIVSHTMSIGWGQTPFKCSCGKSYPTRKPLLKHIRQQTYGKIFKCRSCGLGFTSNFNLGTHVKRIHPAVYKDHGRFGCGNCGRSFHTNEDRIHHRAAEHSESRT